MKQRPFNIIFSLMAGIAVLSVAACKKKDDANKPSSDFTYIINNKVPPAKVEFSNHSVNATDYTWNFGDNTTSKEVSPEHTFTTGGTFTVTLTASGNGGSSQKQYQVTVGAKAMSIRTFTIDSSAVLPNPVNVYSKVSYDGGTYTLNDYYHPPSNTIFKPVAVWSGERFYPVPLTSTITVELFYKDPSNPVSATIGDAVLNTFKFKPADYTTGSKPYPTQVALVNTNGSGKNKIIFDVAWE